MTLLNLYVLRTLFCSVRSMTSAATVSPVMSPMLCHTTNLLPNIAPLHRARDMAGRFQRMT